MKRQIAVAAAFAALFAVGCATQYVSYDDSWTNSGYSEVRLSPSSWRVLVEGNGFAGRAEVEQFLMRRAAELTLEQGKRYFVLDDHDAWSRRRVTESGNLIVRPINGAIVTALAADDGNAFDAVEIVAETDEIADGRLSKAARKTLEALRS
jgi:hypothetical protein